MSLPYDIIRVGLPITNDSVTQEFLDIVQQLIDNKDWVGVMTCDYDHTNSRKTKADQYSAPAGYKILIDNGFSFTREFIRNNKTIGTFGSVWKEKNELGPEASKPVLKSLFDKLRQQQHNNKFTTVISFTPGSPYVDDVITRTLNQYLNGNLKIIDTKSSSDITTEYLCSKYQRECVIRSYCDDFILKQNESVDASKIHIFSCLQRGYMVSLSGAVNKLKPNKVALINIGEQLHCIEYTYEEIVKEQLRIYNSETPYVFAFIFD